MITATFIADVSENYRGNARLYRLSETYTMTDPLMGDLTVNYVVASSVKGAGVIGPVDETLIFPAKADGTPDSFIRMGEALSEQFTEALADAGFAVEDTPTDNPVLNSFNNERN